MKLFTVTIQYLRSSKLEAINKATTIKSLVVLAESPAHAKIKIEESVLNAKVKDWIFFDLKVLTCNEITEPNYSKEYAPGYLR